MSIASQYIQCSKLLESLGRLVALKMEHAPASLAALVKTLIGGPSPKVLDSVGPGGTQLFLIRSQVVLMLL